ncbi:MAG: hypothetical protein GC201_03975 [Alphaproteobacteria bacterium]|nr:hypothetical protein [Alphaproteobacteria bacterium]
MALYDDLASCAVACQLGAQKTLEIMFAMGPKPADPAQALLWEQQTTRLQGQLNSLSAMNSKLTAMAVIEGLKDYAADIEAVGAVAKAAQARIKQIQSVSDGLTRLAKILDLGLAILAAAAAPSPATIAAVVKAGDAVAQGV